MSLVMFSLLISSIFILKTSLEALPEFNTSFNVSLGNTRVTIELDLQHMEYRFSQTNNATFFNEHIKTLDINGSELIITFENVINESSSEIKCGFNDSEHEIEISGCYVSIQSNQTNSIGNYSIGYKFKLAKNTRYVLSEHQIPLNIDETEQGLEFYINRINITFRCFTQMCVLINQSLVPLTKEMNDSFEIYPCVNDGRSYSNLTDPYLSMDFDTECVTKTVFWTFRNILIILLFFLCATHVISDRQNIYRCFTVCSTSQEKDGRCAVKSISISLI
ncbi:hypothetical protein RF11_07775 [Thelohanellus kitauei]|uniref:ZP domain-containing protein n=1 Tax=Thelohanellus kitauei TaxID=669202 RepID=A0A0C2J4B8_THEKT|nr:hypothetical protein RF11_07775 [Thelohanellus kitauei]